jgi:hypothetical protein
MRDEADNASELADLIQGREPALLRVAADAAHEDIFHSGPELTAQLRMKSSVMLAHMRDLARLYETHNI